MLQIQKVSYRIQKFKKYLEDKKWAESHDNQIQESGEKKLQALLMVRAVGEYTN